MPQSKAIYLNGSVFPSVRTACVHFGLSRAAVDYRVKVKGETPAQAINHLAAKRPPPPGPNRRS